MKSINSYGQLPARSLFVIILPCLGLEEYSYSYFVGYFAPMSQPIICPLFFVAYFCTTIPRLRT